MPRWRNLSPIRRPGTTTAGALLVEIISEDGLSGWGEAFGPPALTAPIVEFYKPLLVGADGLATELHWQNLYNRLRDHGQKGLTVEALSAVDIALWDLKGRLLGLPVHRLMGGPLRSRVQAYATGFYRKRDGNPLSYLVDEALQRADAGFSAIKLKLGFGIDDDIRLCREVRRAVGDTMAIMVDANHAYDATAAIRVGRQIEDLDIAWFEEPVPPEDLQGYRQVKSALRIPIAGGEAEFTRWGFRSMLVDRVIDILQPDLCAARRALRMQENRGHGERVRGARQPACVGDRCRARGFIAADRDTAGQPAWSSSDPAASRTRPVRASNKNGDIERTHQAPGRLGRGSDRPRSRY